MLESRLKLDTYRMILLDVWKAFFLCIIIVKKYIDLFFFLCKVLVNLLRKCYASQVSC